MALRRASALAVALAALALPAVAQATEPFACLTGASLDNATEGVAHALDATCSVDLDGQSIVRYEWDLDGDGTFETDTDVSPLTAHAWADRGALLDARVNVGLRVTDSAGESGTTTGEIRVVDTINAWFLFQPQIVNPGDEITLRGVVAPSSTWNPPYTGAWDLDGDGTYETDTGPDDEVKTTAPQALGTHRLGLQITDGSGATSRVHREIEVVERHPSRDMIAYQAPINLGDAPTGAVAPTPIPDAPAALTPDPLPVAPTAPPAPALRRPKLAAIDANRNGLSLRYTGGPKWSLWNVVVRLPAKRAATYGLPRKTVIFARGKIRFDAHGVGTSKMRWTRGAYRVFRQVRESLVEIRARRYR